MKGRKLSVVFFCAVLAVTPLLQGAMWSLKANSSSVITKVNDNRIVVENDMISRIFMIDDQKHMRTSEITNKRIHETLYPAEGSADFVLNTIDTSANQEEAVLPEIEIARTSWNAQVSSADNSSVNKNMQNILDGNQATEVDFSNGKKFPYHFQVDLGSIQNVTSFSYLKRAGNSNEAWGINGTIGKFELFVSENGVDWSSAGKGEFTKEDYNLHTVQQNGKTIYNVGDRVYANFDQTYQTRYIRLDMLSGALSDDPSFTGSDFRLYEDQYQGVEKRGTEITSNDLHIKDVSVDSSASGSGKRVIFEYEPYTFNDITWKFTYYNVIEPGEHFMRSYVEATANKEELAYIDYIELDHFVLDERAKDVWTHPPFTVADSAYSFPGYEFMLGQPIYASGMFFGSEFPGTDTQVVEDEMQIRYYSGKSLAQLRNEHRLSTDGTFVTWPNVIGAAQDTPNDVVQTDFYAYIDTIATQTDFRKQYNSWYDNRMAISDESIAKAFFATEKGLSSQGVEPLDSYVVDDGWNNYNDPEFTGIDVARSGNTYNQTGFWEFNDKFPNELYPAKDMATKFASSFGLWLGPQGGYELQGTFSQYIGKSETGYMHPTGALGKVICTGSKKYIDNLTSLFVDYQSRFDIDYWKLDGFASRPCTQSNHDHMTGGYRNMYFTSELWENWTDAFEAMREQRKKEGKGLFLNATCYVNPSPWILRWVNAVWMQNAGDLESDGTNGGTSSAKMISGRDNIYFKNYKTAQLQFPMKNVYNHDPIYGVSAGVTMNTNDFRDYMMANAVRGTAFWELYFSPAMMDESKWQVTADVLDFAQKNAHILEKAKVFGTAPNQRGVYGYSSWDKQEGIIEFRNPTSLKKTYTLKVDNIIGASQDLRDASIMQILPYKNAMDEGTISYGDEITVTLNPYETRIYQYGNKDKDAPEMVSIKNVNSNTIRMQFNERIRDVIDCTIKGYTISKQTLMEDYKTIELQVSEELQDTLHIALSIHDIAGNILNDTLEMQVYQDHIVYEVLNKQSVLNGHDIKEDIYERNGMTVMQINDAYEVNDVDRLEGQEDFSVRMTVKTTSSNVNLLKQEGAYQVGIDSDGFIVASAGSKQLTSKEVKKYVDEKAHGMFGSDAYVATTVNENVIGRINDGLFHTIQFVREKNGMLKLYVDTDLRATLYEGANKEELKAGDVQFGDKGLSAGVANVQVLNKAIGYDDAQKAYHDLRLERYIALDRSTWTADASSEYKKGTTSAEGPAKNAIDGNTGTLWHTNYASAYPTPLDHWIAFDFGKEITFSRLGYVGRAKGTNGNMKEYILQGMNEAGEWFEIAQGSFEDGGECYVDFNEVKAYGIRLKGISFYGADPKHAAAVEINIYQDMGEQIDYTSVKDYVENMAPLKSEDEYTNISYQEYKEAYDHVQGLFDDVNLTNVKLQQIIARYETALDNLVSLVNLKAIIVKVDACLDNADMYAPSYIESLFTLKEDAIKLFIAGTHTEIEQMIHMIQQLLDAPMEDEDTAFVKGILYNAITKADAILNDQNVVLAPTIRAMMLAKLATANAVYKDDTATAMQVMHAWEALAKALQFADFTANKTALHALIADCKDINLDDYTQGVEEYKAALEEANTVSADDSALQTKIDVAYTRLLAAIEGLKHDSVNKTELKQVIDIAEKVYANAKDYNQEDRSWAIFATALENAKVVYNNNEALQSEINTAMVELTSAYECLRLLPNEELLKTLQTFIETAETMNVIRYCAQDVAFVRSVMADAKTMIQNSEINEAQRQDIQARIALSYKIMAENMLEDVDTPNDTEDESKQIKTPKEIEEVKGTTKTGDTTFMWKYVVLLAGAGLTTYFAKKRK